jgi:Na+-driven multidrug efflux pump
MVALAQLFSGTIASAFSGGDAALSSFTHKGFQLYSLSFFFTGVGIFGSAFFTALCNGTVSATLSFLRTLVLPTVTILTLPSIMGLNGVWLTVVVADGIAFFITLGFIFMKRKQYGYLNQFTLKQ